MFPRLLAEAKIAPARKRAGRSPQQTARVCEALHPYVRAISCRDEGSHANDKLACPGACPEH